MRRKTLVKVLFAAVAVAASWMGQSRTEAGPVPSPFAFRISLAPSFSTVPPGTSASLTVELDKPAPDVMPISLTTTGPAGVVACPNRVTIQAGKTRAKIQVKAVSAGGPVTVTATLPAAAGGASASAQVRVTGLSVSLSPQTLSILKGSVGKLTASLSAPAPAGGVTVAISQSGPAGVVAVPASVTIPAGTSVTHVNVKGLQLGGPVTVTASLPAGLGGGKDTATVSVVLLKLPIRGR